MIFVALPGKLSSGLSKPASADKFEKREASVLDSSRRVNEGGGGGSLRTEYQMMLAIVTREASLDEFGGCYRVNNSDVI
jgi:hypothetical protein